MRQWQRYSAAMELVTVYQGGLSMALQHPPHLNVEARDDRAQSKPLICTVSTALEVIQRILPLRLPKFNSDASRQRFRMAEAIDREF